MTRQPGSTELAHGRAGNRWALMAAFAALFALAACRGTSVKVFDETVIEGREDAELPPLHYGGGLPLKSFDPNGEEGWCEATALLHARLFEVDGRGRVTGDLAEDLEIDPDGLRVLIRLRPEARFHDGSTVRAADVVATFESLKRHAQSEVRIHLAPVQVMRAIGPSLLEIELAHPFAELPDVLTELAILPASLVGRDAEAIEANPIGAGPFKLARRDANFLLFVAHREHHRGSPKLRALALHTIEDDRVRAAATARLMLDLTCVKPESLPSLGDRDRLRIHHFRSGVIRALPLDVQAPGLDDPRVRRALSALIDRDELVREALGGFGRPAYQILAPENVAFDPELEHPAFDVEAARALLDEADWVRGDDGIRRRDGVSLRIRLVAWQGEAFRRRAAELLVASWKREGIDARILAVDHAGYTRLARDLHGHAEAFVGGWGAMTAPVSVLARKFTSGGAQNAAGFSDAEIDRLLSEAEREPRFGPRVALVREAQRRLAELMPWIPLVYADTLFASSTRVSGIDWNVVDSWYEFPRHLRHVRMSGPLQ